jgi:hypothetical protein
MFRISDCDMVGLWLRDVDRRICLTVSYRAQKINIARKEYEQYASRPRPEGARMKIVT